MKRLLCVILSITILIPFGIFGDMTNRTYSDEANIHSEYYDSVMRLSEYEIMQGFQDGSFRPQKEITRAEFCKIIYILKYGIPDKGKPFADMKDSFDDLGGSSAWARGYVNYCKYIGVVHGIDGKKFAPQRSITVGEACKILLGLFDEGPSEALYPDQYWREMAMKIDGSHCMDANKFATREIAARLIDNAIKEAQKIYKEETLGWKTIKENDLEASRYQKAPFFIIKKPTRFIVVLESQYDEENDLAIVKLGFDHHVIGKYKVQRFFNKNKNGVTPDIACDFANNKRYGMIYRAVVQNDWVDLSYGKGIYVDSCDQCFNHDKEDTKKTTVVVNGNKFVFDPADEIIFDLYGNDNIKLSEQHRAYFDSLNIFDDTYKRKLSIPQSVKMNGQYVTKPIVSIMPEIDGNRIIGIAQTVNTGKIRVSEDRKSNDLVGILHSMEQRLNPATSNWYLHVKIDTNSGEKEYDTLDNPYSNEEDNSMTNYFFDAKQGGSVAGYTYGTKVRYSVDEYRGKIDYIYKEK